jgi:hypothetical protein
MHKEKIAEKNGLKVYLAQDEDACNPREEYDNMGTMVCWHRRYSLGDKHEFKSPDDFLEWWKENGKGGVLLSLYLYDHSGITMSTAPFSCPWDSGQVGWIYVTADKIKQEYRSDPDAAKRAEEYLKGEVETYDQYLRGEVYGYILEGPDGEVDSCWGFFGLKYAKDEALAVLNRHASEQDDEENRVLDFIDKHS